MNNNNLIFLIALIAGLGIVYVAVDQAYSTGEAVSAKPVCFDSDNGLTYNVEGYVKYSGFYYNDSCRPSQSSPKRLVEYYCGPNNRLHSRSYNCPNSCFNGKCLDLQNCTNECSSSGVSVCDGSASYRTCGNYDSDPCLELGSSSSCASGYSCSYGVCVPQANQGSCTDSDGGKNYDVKGTLTFNSREVYTDYCKNSTSSTVPLQSGKYLNEMYCSTQESYTSSEYICPYGCGDGACLQQTNTTQTNQTGSCTDSDGGQNYYTTGVVRDSIAYWSDFCQGSTNLVETYCGYDNYSANITTSCSYGCSGGACLQQTNTTQTNQTGSCTDSDLDNRVIKGYVSNGNETYSDFCGFSNGLPAVYEYTCDGNVVKGSYFVCDSGVGAVGSCYDGACIMTPTTNQSCLDQCYTNWPSCSSNNTASWYAPCGNFDSDSCLEWGPVEYCSTGSACSCQNGNCACI